MPVVTHASIFFSEKGFLSICERNSVIMTLSFVPFEYTFQSSKNFKTF